MATDINKVILVGRLVRDCGQQDFGYMQGGQARANISIAANRSKKQGDQWVERTSFFDLTVWGKTAENLHPYLTKGKQVGIVGHLEQDRWEKDGKKFSKVYVSVEDIQLLGGRTGGGQDSQPNAAYRPAPAPQGSYAPPAPQQGGYVPQAQDAGGDYFPEDVPF